MAEEREITADDRIKSKLSFRIAELELYTARLETENEFLHATLKKVDSDKEE